MVAEITPYTDVPKAATWDFLSIVLLAICAFMSMEFVVAGTGGATLSEIAVYFTALWLLLTRKIVVRPAVLFFLALGALTIVPVLAYGGDRVYGPYFKTFLNFAAGLVVFDNLLSDAGRRTRVLKWLTIIGCLLAVYGLLQAVLGFGSVPDIYTIGGAPVLGNASLNLGNEAYKLVGVMRWKASEINVALGTNVVSGLSYGFHWFSNNFAEYLAYVSIAAWVYLASRQRIAMLVVVQVLLAVAIVASGGRTSLLGFLLIGGVFSYFVFARLRPLIWLAAILGAWSLNTLDWSAFFFDRGGSVEGRSALNEMGLRYVTADFFAILFGGYAAEFANTAYSNVHSTFLYYWLYGGIMVAMTTCSTFVVWFMSAARAMARASMKPDRLAYLGVTLALLWFMLYGMTWAAIALPNTIFFVCLFVALRRNFQQEGGAFNSTIAVTGAR